MGRVYRDTRTGWWIADYFDAEGKRRRLKASRDPREARKTLALLEAQAIRNRLLEIRPLKEIRFDEYAKLFLRHAQAELRAKTWTRYRTSLDSLIPFFENVALTAIRPELVERFKGARIEQVQSATVNRDLQCLKRMFNLAISWGYARENPVRLVKFLKERNSRLRYLTREEWGRLLEACPDFLKPIVTVAVNTGMRQGEILALQWSEVDLENGFASVNDPKNGIPRKVPLNGLACEAFEAVRQNSNSIRVFPYSAGWVQHQFILARERAKIGDFRFHDLRHTCASWLVMRDVDIRRVQIVLGHKDIRMTLRYAHLAPEQGADAVSKLEEFIRSSPASGSA